MRKFLILSALFLFVINYSNADSSILTIQSSTTTNTPTQSLNGDEIKRDEIYKTLANLISDKVKTSYSSILLNFKDVKKWTDTYANLQKLVYLDILQNKVSNVFPWKPLNAYVFYSLVEKSLNIKVISESKQAIAELKKRNTYSSDLKFINQTVSDSLKSLETAEPISDSKEIAQKKEIFFDVLNTLKKWHYNRDKLDEKEMLYSAIQGLADGTKDKFTSFFPPTQNKNFQDSLSGNYEGIWAYVDMEEPWKVIIISPIPDGPAYKAWLKWWDIFLSVWENTIEKGNSLNEVVGWIKWPAGTSVKITVKRGNEVLTFNVKREKIVIKEVESKEYSANNTFYIQIKSFWDNTFWDFVKALNTLKSSGNIKKVIIDLRGNPGWYLDVVNEMLGYFVPEWQNVSVIKYYNYTLENKSSWYTDINFNNYQIIILENSWTASAAEIMTGTIKDYFPNAQIIWETSYGKGSVQTIKAYDDGSSLKYTIAKWYTGKTETGIDGIWIKPDIELKITDDDV